MLDKRKLTEDIIKELSLPYDAELAYHTWWFPNSSSNLYNVRLTKVGHSVLSKRLPNQNFEYDFKNIPNELKQLAKMDTPFYVSRTDGIFLYSAQLIVMCKMYDSFARYLELINQ